MTFPCASSTFCQIHSGPPPSPYFIPSQKAWKEAALASGPAVGGGRSRKRRNMGCRGFSKASHNVWNIAFH